MIQINLNLNFFNNEKRFHYFIDRKFHTKFWSTSSSTL